MSAPHLELEEPEGQGIREGCTMSAAGEPEGRWWGKLLDGLDSQCQNDMDGV